MRYGFLKTPIGQNTLGQIMKQLIDMKYTRDWEK